MKLLKVFPLLFAAALIASVAIGCKKNDKRDSLFSDAPPAVTETPDTTPPENPDATPRETPPASRIIVGDGSDKRNVVNDMRMLLRNGKTAEAKRYVDAIDVTKVSADVGEVYHFKGVVYFLLAQDSRSVSDIQIALDSFQRAERNTRIEKIKALSFLWTGMVYEYFYEAANTNELKRGEDALNRVINEYGKTRFANDAVFYKALIHKKRGDADYRSLLNQAKSSSYVDPHVYYKWTKRYVRADQAVNAVLSGKVQ